MTNLLAADQTNRPFRPTKRCFGYSTHLLGTLHAPDEVIHVDVVGGDHAKPGRQNPGHVTIMVEREGYKEKKQHFAERRPSEPGLFFGKKMPEKTLHDGGNELYVFDNDVQHVSSTKIRDLLKKLRCEENADVVKSALQSLSSDGCVMQSTADYMAAHWKDLILAPVNSVTKKNFK